MPIKRIDVTDEAAVEELVQRECAAALGRSTLGLDDAFGGIGDLVAVAPSLAARLSSVLGMATTARAVLAASTPRELARTLRRELAAQEAQLVPIPRVDRARRLPLSSPEARLWFVHRLDPDSPSYNECATVHVHAELDEARLRRAFAALERRHEALRTRFVDDAEGPRRVIEPPRADPALTFLDARDLAEACARLQEPARRPFRLESAPLWRGVVVRIGGGSTLVSFVLHHLVTDEWSCRVLFRDLGLLYEHAAAGEPDAAPGLPERVIDYADWAAWTPPNAKQAEEHFRSALEEVQPIDLAVDHGRGVATRYEGQRASMRSSKKARGATQALAREERTSVVVVALAALAATLHRHSGTTRFAIGLPLANRARQDVQEVVGAFMNHVAVAFDFSDRPTFRTLVRRTRDTVMAATENATVAFERVIEAFGSDRGGSSRFFRIAFTPRVLPPSSFAGVRADAVEIHNGTSKFDLTFFFTDHRDALELSVEYATALFERPTVENLLERFGALCESAASSPDRRVGELARLQGAELRRVVGDWNDTSRPFPGDRCVHDLFAEQASKRPDAVALRSGGRSMTYRELDVASSLVAAALRRAGVTAETRVGISSLRSLDLYVGLLGILKAGGAYVPLDPSWPRERIALLVREAALDRVLDPRNELALPEGVRVIATAGTDALAAPLEAESRSSRSAAYVMFTSGSTGVPKGVCVEHRAIVRLVRGVEWAKFDEHEVFLAYAPLAFDASTLEIWGPLSNGGTVAVAPPGVLNLSELASVIRNEGVTVAFFTTGLFNQLVANSLSALTGLRQLFTGGELATTASFRRVLAEAPNVDLSHVYGPTENTTFSTCHHLRALGPDDPVPIGGPITNTTVYVLDDEGMPVAPGELGELYTGGEGLARGYLSPAATAEKFVPDPFSATPGARMYRTGDLVRWLADGTVNFIGRRDQQVKLRGFRIELGEIETKLAALPGVRESVVMARRDRGTDARLVAYVVLAERGAADAATLRAALARELPDYMVPSAVVFLDAMPLNANGKVDRKALPEPDDRGASAYVEPHTPLEQEVATVWRDVLRLPRVSRDADFFAVGGHSLLAATMTARVADALGIPVPVRTVFDAPTLAEFAERVLAIGLAAEGHDAS